MNDSKNSIKNVLTNNMVTIIFIVIGFIGIKLSRLPSAFILNELVIRIGRNSFLVLALIIPVLAGMGLNFSIVVGAMAGQMAIIAVTHWGITGIQGLLLCAILATPIALLVGNLTGRLLNKTRGQEMIASMIVGFFANGIYQLIFLYLIGTAIPMKNPMLVLDGGVGIRNSIDLSGGVKPTGIKYTLDGILKYPLFKALLILAFMMILFSIISYYKENKRLKLKYSNIALVIPIALIITSIIRGIGTLEAVIMIYIYFIFITKTYWDKKQLTLIILALPLLAGLSNINNMLYYIIVSIIGCLFLFFTFSSNACKLKKINFIILITICFIISALCIFSLLQENMLSKVKMPVFTFIVIALLCIFNLLIVKTKIGQDFRTVGQNLHIAKVSGINIDKTRVLAITISTLLAAWGQIIFLQNIGTLNTYGSHEQIGMFSIAALLIGGASVSKATISQALLGTTLFHILFIVSPQAGKNVFGDAQIGEFFRAFVVYGVIGVSLGLHAFKRRLNKNQIAIKASKKTV
ncbi:ABC transporter permease [Clostridiaceae bacterium M8S5]|nr:ABC transporter permease [Clostridiaceae bacterium M8S5]